VAQQPPANAVFVYSSLTSKLLGHVHCPKPLYREGSEGSGPSWDHFLPDGRTVYDSTCGTKSVSPIECRGNERDHSHSRREMPDRISTLVLP